MYHDDMTWMTVNQVAEASGVSERTVRRWLRDGRLEAERVGGRVRIASRAVREMAVPYGTPALAPVADGPDPVPWWEELRDPDRVASVTALRIARALALMDQVRGMSSPGDVGSDAVGLVREGRAERDARWDEPHR